MFRNLNRRTAAIAGRVMLVGALLGVTGTATIALGAAKKAPAPAAKTAKADPAKTNPAWQTQAYSKTSEFAQRLTLLEFSEKNNSACEPTTKLLNEMRRKNYPIQRVEKSAGGEVLFDQYNVETVPTLVLLFDGKEFGRVVVKKDDVKVTAKRLLSLFQKGRDAVAANPRTLVKEPEYVSQAKPALGFLFPHAVDHAMQARAQAPDAAAPADPKSVEAEVSVLDTRTEEISNLIGEARLEASTVRVVVKDPKGGVAREGVGSAIHYNSEYHEALAVVAANVFTGIADPVSYPDVTLEVFDPSKNAVEKVGAQCVRCDPDAGVAFVAAQVESPVKPVAFLPKKSPLEPGERGVSFTRNADGVAKAYHDVLAVDQRRFYENKEEQSAFVSYVEVSNPPKPEDVGCGLFVLRNGRFYFAGLFVSSSEKGCVVPAPVVSQALLVNRNLTTVYRDQIANKFDAPATDAEIDAAIDRLAKLDAQKKNAAPVAKTDPVEAAEKAAASATSVALSDPVSTLDENGKPVVDFTSADPTVAKPEDRARADVALAGATGEQSSLSAFPENAEAAFARSEAIANALGDNSSFQVAEEYQRRPEPDAAANEATLAAATPEPAAKSAPEPISPEVAAATRSQLAYSDLPAAPEPAAAPETASDPLPAPAPEQDPLYAAQDETPFPDPLGDPLADPLSDPLGEPLSDSQTALLADSALPEPEPEPTAAAPAPRTQPQVEERLVARAATPAPASPYAADPLPTPNSDLIRSTTFSNREQVEAFNKEEEQFEAAIDALRRRGMEGAEIICIVNWSDDANGSRETEVVRIPRRTVLSNPSAPGAGVELAAKPDSARTAAQTADPTAYPQPKTQDSVPMTSNLPDSRLYK